MALHHHAFFFGPQAGNLRRQEFDPAKMCLPGTITTLPGCDKVTVMQTRIQELRERNAPKEELARYMCTQEYLDASIACKNDMRQCMLTTDFDAGWDATIAEWNEACRPFFSVVPTTPADIPLTATYEAESCQSAYSLCERWDAAESSCSSSHTASAALSSCLCRGDIIAFASGCEVDGSVNCLRKTPDPATMWGASYCSATPTIPAPGGGPGFTGGGKTTSLFPGPTASTPSPNSGVRRYSGGFRGVVAVLFISLLLGA